MEGYIELPQCSLNYRISGNGPAVVLLHGYLEDLSIWDNLTENLESDYTVLSIDLPGHGKSICKNEVIRMDFMADCVSAVMRTVALEKVWIIGHSMGGYVSLAFAERYPSWLNGLCLLHSTPNADTHEKHAARLADINLVKQGGKEQLVQNNIPHLFATQNLQKFADEVQRIKAIARNTSDIGIIGALNGMLQRPDRNHVIEHADFPVTMIFGKHDNLINLSVAQGLEKQHKKAQTVYLNNSGHMSFIEEPHQITLVINSFLT